MISKEEYTRIISDLSILFKECETLHVFLIREWHYYKDEIQSGDYSDDAVEAIIRGTFNDYEVHLLSMCYQMFSYDNCIDRLKEDKYCVLVDYMKDNMLINFKYLKIYLDFTLDNMEKIKVVEDDNKILYNLEEYELLLFMYEILKLNENKKFI
jgi:hypothetical protein